MEFGLIDDRFGTLVGTHFTNFAQFGIQACANHIGQCQPSLEKGFDLGFFDCREIEVLQQSARLEIARKQGIGRIAEEVFCRVMLGHVLISPLSAQIQSN